MEIKSNLKLKILLRTKQGSSFLTGSFRKNKTVFLKMVNKLLIYKLLKDFPNS